jgi:hypothetical protein
LITKVLKAKPEKSNRQIATEVKASHVTVGAVRGELESTGQINQLKKTTGKDGKARPARIKRVEHHAIPISPSSDPGRIRNEPSKKLQRATQELHQSMMGEPLFDIGALVSAWAEVETQHIAGNKTRLKTALQRLLKETAAALARVRS